MAAIKSPVEYSTADGTLRGSPTLAIRGALSDILSAETFSAMAEAHPGLTAVAIPNRGYPPMLDEPAAVNAVDAFLRGLQK